MSKKNGESRAITLKDFVGIDIERIPPVRIAIEEVQERALALSSEDLHKIHKQGKAVEKLAKIVLKGIFPTLSNKVIEQGELNDKGYFTLTTSTGDIIAQPKTTRNPDMRVAEKILAPKGLFKSVIASTIDLKKLDALHIAGLITDKELEKIAPGTRYFILVEGKKKEE